MHAPVDTRTIGDSLALLTLRDRPGPPSWLLGRSNEGLERSLEKGHGARFDGRLLGKHSAACWDPSSPGLRMPSVVWRSRFKPHLGEEALDAPGSAKEAVIVEARAWLGEPGRDR